jgi:hypothetical protein
MSEGKNFIIRDSLFDIRYSSAAILVDFLLTAVSLADLF